ncbi:hypothetical protein MMC34_005047 [Xylographa carneopallida]|nr:hypothetical protein [Xylographa carneopallida]
MGAKKRRSKKSNLLSHTRLQNLQPLPPLSSRATRNVIRKHHTLQKQLSQAVTAHNDSLAKSLRSQIDAAGGLSTYQHASILGQSATRGGDSSRVLMEWLIPSLKGSLADATTQPHRKLRLLEVGALSIDNACSRSGYFDVERIDLHSQHADILEQDFMKRPVPERNVLHEEGFDVVSLSLVVNYVGDAKERGDMLRRAGSFMRMRRDIDRMENLGKGITEDPFPALFLVLPAPCVLNSRYLDEETLERLVMNEGYDLAQKKLSKKLVYYLWRFRGAEQKQRQLFRRVELRPGGARNNFSIVMR